MQGKFIFFIVKIFLRSPYLVHLFSIIFEQLVEKKV